MKKPNIVYILADDMGYGDISLLNPRCAWQTTALDMLGRQGMHFTDAHAVSALCTPSRYSILTGRYCWRSPLKQDVITGYDLPLIEEGRQTVAHFLKSQGYNTSYVGKWHLGLGWQRQDETPESIEYTKPLSKSVTDYGFDSFFGIPASLDLPPYVYIKDNIVTHPPDHTAGNYWDKGNSYNKQMYREGPCAPDFVHEKVLETLTGKALESLDALAAAEKPFFLFYSLTAPHTPILPNGWFSGRSGTSDYGDFVLMCDDIVEKIDERLATLGIKDDTIVVFTSDNGCSPRADYPELSQYGHNPSNIFRGTKFDIFEGGHRVPLLVRWPGIIPAGTSCDSLCSLMDFFATMADILQTRPPPRTAEDSVSSLPLWKKGNRAKNAREELMTHSMNGSLSLRSGRWKLILCPDSGGKSEPIPGDTPLHFPQFQLYDMDSDVRERVNLARVQPGLVEELRKKAASIIKAHSNTGGQPWPGLEWMST